MGEVVQFAGFSRSRKTTEGTCIVASDILAIKNLCRAQRSLFEPVESIAAPGEVMVFPKLRPSVYPLCNGVILSHDQVFIYLRMLGHCATGQSDFHHAHLLADLALSFCAGNRQELERIATKYAKMYSENIEGFHSPQLLWRDHLLNVKFRTELDLPWRTKYEV